MSAETPDQHVEVPVPEEAVAEIREGFEHVMSKADARDAARRAAPFIAAKAVEEKEEADRKERLKRLLGEDWPRVTMLRDKGAKSSPPWSWWMEDDGYDHDDYEAQDYVPASSLDQAVQQERERLKNVLPRLLDSYTADVIRHVEGAPGAGNDRARSQAKILAALDQEGDGDG